MLVRVDDLELKNSRELKKELLIGATAARRVEHLSNPRFVSSAESAVAIHGAEHM